MPRIKLTPELLEQCAIDLDKANEQNGEVVVKLDNIINNLELDWEGDAQRAFKDSYSRKRSTFQNVSHEMKIFVDFLKKFADIMKQEEERQRNKATGL